MSLPGSDKIVRRGGSRRSLARADIKLPSTTASQKYHRSLIQGIREGAGRRPSESRRGAKGDLTETPFGVGTLSACSI